MAVSDSTFARLVEANPSRPAPEPVPGDVPTSIKDGMVVQEPASGEDEIKKSRDDSKVSSSRYLWESFTKGLSAMPEVANLVTRTLLPFDAVKNAIPAGRAESAVGRTLTPERANKFANMMAGGGFPMEGASKLVTEGEGSHEDVLRKDPGVLTKAVAPLVEGIGMAPMGLVPGAGLGKAALIGAGASEGAELGKDVLGATGEFVGDMVGHPETGRKIGEGVGSIAGGGVGGYANVVRYNTVAQGAKMGGSASMSALKAAPAALKAARAAQAAGDERNLFPIFMDQFGDLRKAGLGFIQERTNEKVSGLIARDPRSEKAIEDFRTSAKSVLNKGEEELFSTSQIADNPTLYKMETTRRIEGDPGAVATAFKREGERRKALTSAYSRIVDHAIPADTQTMAKAVNALAADSMDKIRKLEEGAADIRGGVRNFTSEGRRGNGSAMRDQFESELAKSKAVNEENYQQAYKLDTMGVDIGASKGPVRDVLRQFESQIKEGTAPPSITNLKRAIEAGEDGGLILPGGKTTGTRVPLKDVDQVIKDLGSDSHDAYSAYERSKNSADLSRAKNLEKVQESLLGSIGTTNPEAASAYHAARSRYAADHAPRFNSGVASAMETERHAPGQRGRPRYPDETVMDQFLNKAELPTRMGEFDKLFGGFGGAVRNDAAYKTLSNAVEDRFSKEVLSNFTPERAEKFMREYESALDRMPGTRNKIVSNAENLDKIAAEQKRIEQDFKDLIGSDITQKIGPVQAAQLFTQSLADPIKMEKLLTSELGNSPDKAQRILKEAMAYANPLKPNGEVDYTKLAKLMESGQSRVDMPNTLEMLTNKALGTKEGPAHLERLRQVSELMRRDAMLDPEHLRIADKAAWGDNPVKASTGQTLASWLTGFRTMDAGFGKHYFPLISAGRFVNTRIQSAVEGSIQKALYDPDVSRAVLEMVATPNNQAIGSKTLDVLFGSSTELRRIVQKNLLEQGMVRRITEQGALIGAAKTTTDKERAQKRMERKRILDLE